MEALVQFPVISQAKALWEDALSQNSLHPKVRCALDGLPSGTIVGVACSGGADSVCTLWLMAGWAACSGGKVVVLHYNHRLRAVESDLDAAFVEKMSAHLGCSFFLGQSRGARAEAAEAALRAERHDFFKKILTQTNSQYLVLGHHLGDVAETFLMRWMRGSSSRGLCAPRPVQSHPEGLVYLRPLMNACKPWILQELKKHSIPWREDASNVQELYVRNWLRLSVIPELEKKAPQRFALGIERTRSLLEEEDEALEAWVDCVWTDVFQDGKLKIEPLRRFPKGLIRRALWRWLLLNKLSLGSGFFSTLLETICNGKSARFSAGAVFVVARGGILSVQSSRSSQPYCFKMEFYPKQISIPGGFLILEQKTLNFGERLENGCWLPMETDFPLTVRTWRVGDAYRGLGAPGTKKLQDHFIDRKIPKELRGFLPVIVSARGDILWVPGLVPSEKTRIQSGNVHALRLTYQKELS